MRSQGYLNHQLAQLKVQLQKFSHGFVAAGALVFVLAGCFEVEDITTGESRYDFVSTPVKYQVVSEQVASGEMLPSAKTYSFETCLQDRITLSSMALNEFIIDGAQVISDEEGCVIWTKEVAFHPYAQSRTIEDTFVITSEGKYPGRLEIDYYLNPWTGSRPTSTAEFVESIHTPNGVDTPFMTASTSSQPSYQMVESLFAGKSVADPSQQCGGEDSEASAASVTSEPQFAQLKVASIIKQVFYHNELSLSDQIHLGLLLSPVLEVYDQSGISHNLIPQVGDVAVHLDILVINKDLEITDKNLLKAKKLKSFKFKDLVIESGVIKINEHIDAFQVLADENIVLRAAIHSPTQWGAEGLRSPESMYFVRQSEESEVLQEVHTIDGTSCFEERSVEIVSAEGKEHSFFFADEPRISHIDNHSRTTTSIQYNLLFSTRLIHKNSESVVKNMDLYVTHDAKTGAVHVGPDGLIHYLFDFDYDMYSMQSRPQYLEFKISNKDGSIAVDVPLFLKPWQPSSQMAINPETLSDAKVAALQQRQWPKPELYIDEITLDTATPIEYKVGEDLSLMIRHSYNMDAVVKVRSEGVEAFGGERILPAPTGHYKLDVYLTCPSEGLLNRSLYNVDVADSLDTLTVTRAAHAKDLKNLCPSAHTSFDILVENGRATGTFQVMIPEPRMTWSRSQLTLVLHPYKTSDLSGELAADQRQELAENFAASPVARVIILEDFASKSKKVAMRPLNYEYSFSDLFSFADVKLATAKWQVAYPYIAHVNALEQDYLRRNMLNYVSLDGHEYSALEFEQGSDVDTTTATTLLPRTCDVAEQECLQETSPATLSYQDFMDSYTGYGIRDMKFTLDELKDVVWNRPGNRLDELIDQTCYLWELSYQVRLQRLKHVKNIVPNSAHNAKFMAHLEDIMGPYGGFTGRCIHETKIHPYAHSGHVAPVTAVHHLKGPVVAVHAEDAGVDILNFTQKNISKLGHTVSFYTAAHLDVLGTFYRLINNIGAFAGASGYSFNLMGEYEVVKGDNFAGGMNHYSNWTTVKMGLQFAQPKYCLTLRMDPYYLYSLMNSVRDNFDRVSQLDDPRHQNSEMYRDFWSFIELFEHDISHGYLICTEEQPPGFDAEQLQAETHYPLHQDTTAIGMEYYRFAGPRFSSDALYDTTQESFRDWVYPLRGQADYLKFIHSMTNMNQNQVESMHGYGNAFQWSSELVTWFMKDKSIKNVNQYFHPTAREYVKFPKRYVYSRFSAVPPSIGGFYNY